MEVGLLTPGVAPARSQSQGGGGPGRGAAAVGSRWHPAPPLPKPSCLSTCAAHKTQANPSLRPFLLAKRERSM